MAPRRPGTPGERSIAAAIVGIALGAALVELAYAGRAGTRWGLPTYWAGEMLLYGAAGWAATRRGTREGALFALVLALGTATFLLKVGYSPVRFTSVDEFQHLRSLNDLLATHHLFHPNPSLSVGPDFPGLEIATSAVIATTGLSPFAAGLVVTGFSHALLCGASFVLFKTLLRSSRLAALATVIFATEPHFGYFDAIFAYQTPALPLLLVALTAGTKLLLERGATARREWMIAGLLSAGALLFTHHLTMLVLLILLAILALVGIAKGTRAPALFFALCATASAVWIGTEARGTIAYLGKPVYENLLSALPGHGTGSITHGSPTTQPPFPDSVLAYAAVLLTLSLLVAGWWQLARHGRASGGRSTRPALVAFAVAGLAYPLVLFVREFAGDSSELAGRALTFALIPVAVVVAPTLARLGTRRSFMRWTAQIAVILLLAAGGIVTGLPPWWERLPGSFRIASFERGVDAQNIAASLWVGSHLPPNRGFASDFIGGSLVGALGDQRVIFDDAPLFYAMRFGAEQRREIRTQGIDYLLVDERMADGLPAAGGYFAFTPHSIPLRKRMPRASLTKYDASGVDRIYDSGAIVIYRVGTAK